MTNSPLASGQVSAQQNWLTLTDESHERSILTMSEQLERWKVEPMQSQSEMELHRCRFRILGRNIIRLVPIFCLCPYRSGRWVATSILLNQSVLFPANSLRWEEFSANYRPKSMRPSHKTLWLIDPMLQIGFLRPSSVSVCPSIRRLWLAARTRRQCPFDARQMLTLHLSTWKWHPVTSLSRRWPMHQSDGNWYRAETSFVRHSPTWWSHRLNPNHLARRVI